MKSARIALLFVGVIGTACLLLAAQALAGFVTQKDQIAVAIVVNVTPAPLSYRHSDAPPQIIARFTMHARGSAAQVDSQRSVKVQAEVTPNPNATMLYSDQPVVTLTGTAGTTVTQTCAFHVTVDTTARSWTLDHGLNADFSSSFNGMDLKNNSYLGTPQPQPTPYVVYADDGGRWAVLNTNTGKKTYCIDLSLAIPASVPGGTYSTNAVYTLYF